MMKTNKSLPADARRCSDGCEGSPSHERDFEQMMSTTFTREEIERFYNHFESLMVPIIPASSGR